MGVRTSEVGYNCATARRGDHESSYEHVVAFGRKKNIFQYPLFDVRRDLVHNIHRIEIHISCYVYLFSLTMAVIAETCSWWLLIDKAVFRLDLHLFYLVEYKDYNVLIYYRGILYWRMEEISWTERVTNKVAVNTVKEEWNSIATIKQKRLTSLVISCIGTAF